LFNSLTKENNMRKENKKERVLARMLAEEELKSTQGADQTVVTHGVRLDLTDTNNGDKPDQ
jgi:hypothetical protein